MHSDEMAESDTLLTYEVIDPYDEPHTSFSAERLRRQRRVGSVSSGPSWQEPVTHGRESVWSNVNPEPSFRGLNARVFKLEHTINAKFATIERKLDSIIAKLEPHGRTESRDKFENWAYSDVPDVGTLREVFDEAADAELVTDELTNVARTEIFSDDLLLSSAAARVLAQGDKLFARSVLPDLIDSCTAPTRRAILAAALRNASQ